MAESLMPLGDTDDLHVVGDPACEEGWCGNVYPKPCDNGGCPGLIHASYCDETDDGYYLYTRCDVCGEAE